MSEPERRQVRVRRSPKIGVFLLIGAAVGAIAAVVAVNTTPADATLPKEQAIGFIVLITAPLGALLGGVVALIVDRVTERRATTVEAELITPSKPPEVPGGREGAAAPEGAEHDSAAPGEARPEVSEGRDPS